MDCVILEVELGLHNLSENAKAALKYRNGRQTMHASARWAQIQV